MKPMKPMRRWGLGKTLSLSLALSLCIAPCQAHAEEIPEINHKNALFLDFTRYVQAMLETEQPLVGCDFERLLSADRGWAILATLRGGYNTNGDDTYSAFAGGLGLRKYLYQPFAGSFLQLRSEVGFGYREYDGGSVAAPESQDYRYSITSLEYGYKFQWDGFLINAHAGPSFSSSLDSRSTYLTAGLDIGFPFSAGSFFIP